MILLPMVQKGKFSAAAALFVKTLKNVDFLEKTIVILSMIVTKFDT